MDPNALGDPLPVVSGPDLPGSRPGEAAVLLPILSAAPLPALQATPDPHRAQNSAGGPRVSSLEGIDSLVFFEIHTLILFYAQK